MDISRSAWALVRRTNNTRINSQCVEPQGLIPPFVYPKPFIATINIFNFHRSRLVGRLMID